MRDVMPYYKYGTVSKLEWLRALILEHRLYVPRLSELNDPCEGLWAPGESGIWKGLFEIATAPLDPLFPWAVLGAQVKSKSAQQALEHKLDALINVLDFRRLTEQPRVGMVCMSKRWNNMSLWAKYANDYEGYCLEFPSEETFATAREVVYEEFDPWSNRPKDFLLRKSPDWCNEQEVRFISKEFVGSLMTLNARDLTRIILGKAMPLDHKVSICAWAAARSPALPVSVAEFTHYGLFLRLRSVTSDDVKPFTWPHMTDS